MSEHISRGGIGVDVAEPIVADAEAPLDDMYGALSNERRRRVLSELSHETVPIDVETLARRITERETSDDAGSASDGSTRKVRISLFHQHLPKLADAGLITYDADERVVEDIAGTIDPIQI